jgi:hypothetical protein
MKRPKLKKRSLVPKWVQREPKVRATPANWSESSQRSAISFCHPPHYEDIDYRCTVCGHAAVFSASEQKEAYEVKKRYIWERRHLCKGCYLQFRRIQRKLRECRLKWEAGKATLRRDPAFLREWLDLFEAHHRHGAKRDTANIRRLEKLLMQSA